MRKQKSGSIKIPAGTNIFWHELFIADALAKSGHNVEFIVPSATMRTADAVIDGRITCEFKAPEGNNMRSIVRNLKKAKSQSRNVAISTIRMKGVSDDGVIAYLTKYQATHHSIKRLLFISKDGSVVEIKRQK